MARKKLTGSERKQDILAQSARIFNQYGYDGVSMRQIADACGVNEALLYKHFKGKEELFREIIKGLGPLIDDRLRKIAQEESDSLKALRKILKNLIFEPEENLQIFALIVHGMTASQRHENLRDLVRSSFRKLNDLIFELIENGKKDGTISCSDSEKCSWCLLSRGLSYRITFALKPEGTLTKETMEKTISDVMLECISTMKDSDRDCCTSTELLGI